MIIVGVAALVAALLGGLVWLLAQPESVLPMHRRRPVVTRKGSAITSAATWVSDGVARLVRGRESALSEQLAMASIRMSPVDFLVWNLILSVVLGSLGALALGMVGAILGALVAFGITQGWVAFMSARRRKRFDSQMLETLQIVSGGLRSGQGLSAAIHMVAEEADSPTSEEFARAVNESRIGADLAVSLQQVADRTRSEAMMWMVKTVAINQEVGGSLADAIDGATETIRARVELDGQVKTLAAEGKLSAYILVALPFFVAIVVNLFTPGYLTPLFVTFVGWIVLAVSAVSFIIGGLWMRKIIKIDY